MTLFNVGTTTIGPLTNSGDVQFIVANVYTLPVDATLKSISVYIETPAGDINLGVYSAGVQFPVNLLSSTGPTAPTSGWNTIPVSDLLILAGNIAVALSIDDTGLAERYDNSTGVIEFSVPAVSGTFTDPWTTSGGTAGVFSMYATFDDGAGGESPNALFFGAGTTS